jgi:NitT/TauT family transport system permease protein
MTKRASSATSVLTIAACLLLWELVCRVFAIPSYLLPPPSAVASAIWQKKVPLLENGVVTAWTSVIGFAAGTASGLFAAVGISASKRVAAVLEPVLVVTQVVPKVALAPLFLIWFGFGILPKVIVAALICFFPVVVNTAVGLASVDEELTDLMRSFAATRWEVFRKIRVPNAIPYFFSAAKISVLFSIVGTVTGEFVGADRGLGYLIIVANANFDTTLLFACLVLLSLFGVVSYLSVESIHKAISEKYGGAFRHRDEVIPTV